MRGYGSQFDPIPVAHKLEIKARGADRAVVTFSGGNDEGGPDRIYLLKGDDDTVVAEIEPDWEWDWQDPDEPEKDKLVAWLSGIPDSRYGWGGEGSVHGKVTVDTRDGKIHWKVSESHMVETEWSS